MKVKVDKRKKEAQFRKDLRDLGVRIEFINELMEIHKKNPHLVAYECKRLFNIKRNEEILNQLNLNQIKSEMKPTKPPYNKKVAKEKVVSSPLSRRKSLRISDMHPVNYTEQSYSGFKSSSEPSDGQGKRKRVKTDEPTRKSQRISQRNPVQYRFDDILSDNE